jgi:hypothetical protein
MMMMTLMNLMKIMIIRVTEMAVHCFSQCMTQSRYRYAHLSHASGYLAHNWA